MQAFTDTVSAQMTVQCSNSLQFSTEGNIALQIISVVLNEIKLFQADSPLYSKLNLLHTDIQNYFAGLT